MGYVIAMIFNICSIYNPEGLLTLKPILKELEDRGVQGRILTTDYLGFISPQVLEDLVI